MRALTLLVVILSGFLSAVGAEAENLSGVSEDTKKGLLMALARLRVEGYPLPAKGMCPVYYRKLAKKLEEEGFLAKTRGWGEFPTDEAGARPNPPDFPREELKRMRKMLAEAPKTYLAAYIILHGEGQKVRLTICAEDGVERTFAAPYGGDWEKLQLTDFQILKDDPAPTK